MIDDTGARNGGSTPGGSDPETRVSFSVTVCRARVMSWPQLNSTHTTATPTAVAERTRRTPAAPLSDDSIGNVTSDSISSGSMPGASVNTVTVGAVRSGSTSSGRRQAVHAPHTKNAPAAASTTARWDSDQRISPSIINAPQCTWPCAGTDVDSDASRTKCAPLVTTCSPALIPLTCTNSP